MKYKSFFHKKFILEALNEDNEALLRNDLRELLYEALIKKLCIMNEIYIRDLDMDGMLAKLRGVYNMKAKTRTLLGQIDYAMRLALDEVTNFRNIQNLKHQYNITVDDIDNIICDLEDDIKRGLHAALTIHLTESYKKPYRFHKILENRRSKRLYC